MDFWNQLPADHWNKFHMSWHKSLMDQQTSGSFTAINWPDLCVSSLSDDCVLLALFSCLLSKPLLWAQLYINAFAFPEITFSLWISPGEFKSIDIDGFVTRTNWFRLAFEYPAMWKKELLIRERGIKWKGNVEALCRFRVWFAISTHAPFLIYI